MSGIPQDVKPLTIRLHLLPLTVQVAQTTRVVLQLRLVTLENRWVASPLLSTQLLRVLTPDRFPAELTLLQSLSLLSTPPLTSQLLPPGQMRVMRPDPAKPLLTTRLVTRDLPTPGIPTILQLQVQG